MNLGLTSIRLDVRRPGGERLSNGNRLCRVHTKPKIQKITSFLNYFQAVYTGENGLRLNHLDPVIRLFLKKKDVRTRLCRSGKVEKHSTMSSAWTFDIRKAGVDVPAVWGGFSNNKKEGWK